MKVMYRVLVIVCLGALAWTQPLTAGAVEDAMLGTEIKLSLLNKLGSDALGIEVDVAGSRAHLSGTVDNRSSQELAEEIALAVDGIDETDNRIKLEKPESEDSDTPVADKVEGAVAEAEREVSDAVLESRIGLRLVREIGRHGFRVQVECTDRICTLRGNMPDRERKKVALRTARDTRNVDKVINLLKVKR